MVNMRSKGEGKLKSVSQWNLLTG